MSEIIFAGQVASAITTTGYLSYRVFKRWKKSRTPVFCVLTSRKSGVSTQVKSAISENNAYKKVIVIDEDDVINSSSEYKDELKELRDTNTNSYAVKYLPILEKYLNDVKDIYKNTPVIIFSSLTQVPEYLKIKNKHTLVLVPSTDFFASLIGEKEKSEQNLMVHAREQMLAVSYERVQYRSFKHLLEVLLKIIFCR